MNEENVIVFNNVTKTYKLYKNDKARFKALFSKNVSYKENRAVKNLTFTVKKGESLAFLGRNGAGKSTILKMITGVVFPTEGELEVKGVVSALLELSAGFDPESTGRENIYLKCGLMGMSDDEIKSVEGDIIEFADIGDYIDQPMKSYSSGMKSRLGFAINTNVKPDILIVDEALSVGDKNFRNKCRKKIAEIMESGEVTFLFVTHSLGTARDFCKNGIVLQKGKKMFEGSIDEAIEYYEELEQRT